MKPYKNLNSHHLGPLLLLARIFIYIGILLAIYTAYSIASIFFSPSTTLNMMAAYATLPTTLGMFVLSGIFAAIVAFEENYRVSVNK